MFLTRVTYTNSLQQIQNRHTLIYIYILGETLRDLLLVSSGSICCLYLLLVSVVMAGQREQEGGSRSRLESNDPTLKGGVMCKSASKT